MLPAFPALRSLSGRAALRNAEKTDVAPGIHQLSAEGMDAAAAAAAPAAPAAAAALLKKASSLC